MKCCVLIGLHSGQVSMNYCGYTLCLLTYGLEWESDVFFVLCVHWTVMVRDKYSNRHTHNMYWKKKTEKKTYRQKTVHIPRAPNTLLYFCIYLFEYMVHRLSPLNLSSYLVQSHTPLAACLLYTLLWFCDFFLGQFKVCVTVCVRVCSGPSVLNCWMWSLPTAERVQLHSPLRSLLCDCSPLTPLISIVVCACRSAAPADRYMRGGEQDIHS